MQILRQYFKPSCPLANPDLSNSPMYSMNLFLLYIASEVHRLNIYRLVNLFLTLLVGGIFACMKEKLWST